RRTSFAVVSNNGAQLDDLEDERTQYVFIDRDIVPLLSLPSYFAFISSSIFHTPYSADADAAVPGRPTRDYPSHSRRNGRGARSRVLDGHHDTSSSFGGQEGGGRRGERAGARARLRYTHDGTGGIPTRARQARAVEMDLHIDIDGEAAPRVRAPSPASPHPR
ncbi:hypothetical protein B0H14DRAFT_2917208, partial [Mycena olivaceomarginata]